MSDDDIDMLERLQPHDIRDDVLEMEAAIARLQHRAMQAEAERDALQAERDALREVVRRYRQTSAHQSCWVDTHAARDGTACSICLDAAILTGEVQP